MNQLVKMREWFTEENLPATMDHKFVRTQIWFCAIQGVFQALMIAVEREKNQFVYSYLPETYRNVGTAALWAAYAYYRVSTNFLGGLFQYVGSILTVQTCNQVLELR